MLLHVPFKLVQLTCLRWKLLHDLTHERGVILDELVVGVALRGLLDAVLVLSVLLFPDPVLFEQDALKLQKHSV